MHARVLIALSLSLLAAACKPSEPHEPGACGDRASKCASEEPAVARPGDAPLSSDCVGASAPALGEPAPGLCVAKVSGAGPQSLAEARGQVTIIDFWGTFCGPCEKSFPHYQQLVDKHAGDVVVIAVSVDDPDEADVAAIEGFGKRLGVSFPLVWDREGATAKLYRPEKMPTSYVLDREGVLRHIHAGYTERDAAVLADEVEALLK